MLFLWMVACADEGEPAVPEPTEPTGCVRQAWPIETEGHQLDRVMDDSLGFGAFYRVPEAPRGLVVFHHANNKSVGTLFTVEHEEFFNELASRDIAYLAVDSTDAGWSSEDVQRIAAFRDHVIEVTALRADTPMLGVGFSGGASFLGTFATGGLELGWDVRGVAAHNGVPSQAPVPAIFVSHENDDPASAEAAAESWEDAATLHALAEEPLDVLRFTRIAAVDEARARLWFDDLVAMGTIDADGTRLVPLSETGSALDAFVAEQAAQGRPGAALAKVQLSVAWRLHIFSADAACEVATAFDSWL